MLKGHHYWCPFVIVGVMGKYLITGRPGSGKTTVIRELKNRGYAAYNTDELEDVTKLENKATGEIVPWPDGPVDWEKFVWNWQDAGLRKLLEQDGDIFFGAIVGNQKDYYPLFDKIFALTLSSQTLAHRLDTHEHPHTKAEKEKALAVHEEKQKRWEDQGLILISSDQTISKVVDEILSHI